MPDALTFVIGAIVLPALGGFVAGIVAALAGISPLALPWQAGTAVGVLALVVGTASGVVFGRVLQRRECAARGRART